MSIRNYLLFRVATNAGWGLFFIAAPTIFFKGNLRRDIEAISESELSSKVLSVLGDSFVSLGYVLKLLIILFISYSFTRVLRATVGVSDLAHLLRGRVSRVHIIYTCSIELIQAIMGIYLWGTGNWNSLFISAQ
jgi:hypothetical protein